MHRTEARLLILRGEAPRVLAWSAGLTLVISGLNWLEEPEAPIYQRGADLVAATILVGCALVLAKGRASDRWVPGSPPSA